MWVRWWDFRDAMTCGQGFAAARKGAAMALGSRWLLASGRGPGPVAGAGPGPRGHARHRARVGRRSRDGWRARTPEPVECMGPETSAALEAGAGWEPRVGPEHGVGSEEPDQSWQNFPRLSEAPPEPPRKSAKTLAASRWGGAARAGARADLGAGD